MPIPTLIIAGTHSGSGKTTVTLALLAALVRRGVKVQGFKVGPDFIDPGHHARITGRPGRNLDTWLLDDPNLTATFHRGAAGAELALIEGVMGLFDGRGGPTQDEAGSTADLARRWGLPVALTIDARGLARSIAPLVQGFVRFDPAVDVAAVVANRVGSARHFVRYLAPALRGAVPEVAAVGYLPRNDDLAIPSRHLGLFTADELALEPGTRRFEALANAADASIDIERLLSLARVPRLANVERVGERPTRARVKVGVARDPAFGFYYQDNLDLLQDAGAELVSFSPLSDPGIPEGVELVYLGGGYPELHAATLSANASFRRSIERYHDEGGAIFAECGGLMACAERSATDRERCIGCGA